MWAIFWLAVVWLGACAALGYAAGRERRAIARERELARWEWSLEKRESDLQKSSRD